MQDGSTDFEFLPIDVSLARCFRYYYTHFVTGTSWSWSVNANQNLSINFATTMRSSPTYKGILSGSWNGTTPSETYVSINGYAWVASGYFYGNGSLKVAFDSEL